MTRKKARIALGKEIRKTTGIPFVQAMQIGKILYNSDYSEVETKFPGVSEIFTPVCGCCGSERSIKGPKGEYRIW